MSADIITAAAAHCTAPNSRSWINADLNDPEVLRSALCAVTASRDGWSSRLGGQILAVARSRYGHMARDWGRHPDDAMREAWIVLRQPATLRARDPWAVVATGIRRAFGVARQADRALVSDSAARHKKAERAQPASLVRERTVLTGHLAYLHAQPHSPENSAAIGRAETRLLALEQAVANAAVARLADMSCTDGRYERPAPEPVMSPALEELHRRLTHVLTTVGWSASRAEQALMVIAARVRATSSPKAAAKKLAAETEGAEALGLSPTRWAGLCAFVVGTRSGQPGAVELLANRLTARPGSDTTSEAWAECWAQALAWAQQSAPRRRIRDLSV